MGASLGGGGGMGSRAGPAMAEVLHGGGDRVLPLHARRDGMGVGDSNGAAANSVSVAAVGSRSALSGGAGGGGGAVDRRLGTLAMAGIRRSDGAVGRAEPAASRAGGISGSRHALDDTGIHGKVGHGDDDLGRTHAAMDAERSRRPTAARASGRGGGQCGYRADGAHEDGGR